jgi:hypothetical protein
MYYNLPSDPQKQKYLLQRFMRENLAVEVNIQASRRRPQPPRSLFAIWTNSHFNLSWQGPQNMSGILGFNIYRDNDNNRIQNLANAKNLFAEISMPVGFVGKVGLWVSTYTSLLESIKVQVIAST